MKILDQGAGAKVTHGAAAITSGTGITTFFDILPDVLGIIATTVGIVVTLALWFKQRRKLDLEIKVLQMKIDEIEDM